MRKLYLVYIFLLIAVYGYSQKFHYPEEISKLIANSKLSYNVNAINKPIVCKEYSGRLNVNNFYRVSTATGLSTRPYTLNEKAKPIYDKAEAFFKTRNVDSALMYYKLTLAADSTIFNVMTYIGQIYEKRIDLDSAMFWYKKAISKNYIDYMAHWFLADAYLARNDMKNAVDEIVIARILNRNNPRLKESMINIFDKDQRNKEDWSFNPQVEIIKTADDKITVSYNENWIHYAMVKALWAYEPGYRESMGGKKDQYSMLEDQESLICMIFGQDIAKTQTKKDTQLTILKTAAQNKRLNEYILYEILLPQNPIVAYQLPEKTILSIKDYILSVRNTK